MAALCLLTMSGAFAYKVGEARVAIGANLDSEQIAAVYSDFGIERGVIPEITVTNENERQYLEGLVDDKKIGHKAILLRVYHNTGRRLRTECIHQEH